MNEIRIGLAVLLLAGSAAAATYLGGIDGDGLVGIEDPLDRLPAWGPSGDDCESADLDLDGDAGITDLLTPLSHRSPNPRP